ncbi:MAG: NADH-quinone oxidoreductase subunit J [Actinomycetota bacterium]|nr:NADH-quinone oxidoreductase subunit J [Actinomycetota bacterium]
MDLFVFAVAATCALAGALGVIISRNTVHAALSLVGTLFSIAVLFVAQEANFLAAVQVIVYAGAIVVLFLFVIMLLGIDQTEDLTIEPIGKGQRPTALILGLAVLAMPILALVSTEYEATGARAVEGASNRLGDAGSDLAKLGESLFTNYLFAFEVTSVLLVIAVVGAVVLARKVRRAEWVDDPLVAAAEAEAAAKAEARKAARAARVESADEVPADESDAESPADDEEVASS